MSSASRCLSRLSLQLNQRTTAKRKLRCPEWRNPLNQLRTFSSAPVWLAEESNPSHNAAPASKKKELSSKPTKKFTIDDLTDESRVQFDRSTPEEQQEWRTALRSLSEVEDTASFSQELEEMDPEIAKDAKSIELEAPMTFPDVRPSKLQYGFWAEDEDDEFGQLHDNDDDFQADDMTTPAHAQLDLHRDMREYQRRIAWDMPLLKKFAKPYTPPSLTTPLRFRYTTYMGEQHPASSKVVLELCPRDLPSTLVSTPQQQDKLIKLAGVRYNPSRGIIKMSCEKFDTPAQNKRYLGDLIQRLIDEARDPDADTFEDVPFDFRHHRPKKRMSFPDEWRLGSTEKVRGLVEGRERRRVEAEAKSVVNGESLVKQYVETVEAFQARQPKQPVVVGGQRRPLAR